LKFSGSKKEKMMKCVLVYALLQMFMFWTSGNGQVRTNLPKNNSTVAIGQPNPIKSGQGNVHCSLQDKKGNLWFGTTSQGVFRYDGKSFTNFTTRDGLNSNAVFSMVEDKKGNIWFGTDTGLSHYDGKTFAYIPLSFTKGDYVYPSTSPTSETPTANFVTSMLEDSSGKLWFGTDNGVYWYDGKVFTRFLANQHVINSNGLKLQLVQCMLEDKQGTIWFTTKLEGVCRYDGKSIINYKPNNEEWFRGLLEDKNGNIWAGTRYRGVYRYDGKTFTKLVQNGSFDSYTVLSIIQDKSGTIWFGTEAGDESKRSTEGGIWRYDGKVFQNISTKDDLSHPAVWSILEDKAGNFWIGTRSTGLCRYDGKTFTSFSE
jgi:ligand-binding sensor domain-containing protein